MNGWSSRLMIAGMGFLLAGVPGRAQDTHPRDLIGTVTDHGSREPLKGAVVLLENESSKEITSYLTDAGGNYLFKRLRNDTDYLVWARYRGKESKQGELSHFDSNQHPVIHLVIELH